MRDDTRSTDDGAVRAVEIPKAHSTQTVGHVWVDGRCECGAERGE